MACYYEERTLSVYTPAFTAFIVRPILSLFETVKLICGDFAANKHLISLSSNNTAIVLQIPSNEILIIF